MRVSVRRVYSILYRIYSSANSIKLSAVCYPDAQFSQLIKSIEWQEKAKASNGNTYKPIHNESKCVLYVRYYSTYTQHTRL